MKAQLSSRETTLNENREHENVVPRQIHVIKWNVNILVMNFHHAYLIRGTHYQRVPTVLITGKYFVIEHDSLRKQP